MLASLLFAIALVRADHPCLLPAVLPSAPAVLTAVHTVGLGDDERAIYDASSITLTGSALVERGTPMIRLKTMMDPEINTDVTSWSSSATAVSTAVSALVLPASTRPRRAHPPQRADATSLTMIAAILLRASASSSAADLNGRCSPVQRNCTRSSGTLLA